MIEVRKLIPQVYNQSRDFSVFTGLLQILLNEYDMKDRILESIPTENILPGELSKYSNLKPYFRTFLKNKGSNQCLLYSVYLCGGKLFSFDEEERYLESGGWNIQSEELDRSLSNIESLGINKNSLVYYEEKRNGIYLMHINIKDLGTVDKGLLNKLSYYLKPANMVILLEQALI